MQLTGAKILMECLVEQGVDTIFGYPGGTILNVYDELYNYQGKINHILTAHEQGASHAADGYARSTGKVGVCFATSGPGATNLTTGIATAHMDSSPVVFISCNVAEPLIGKDSFQEVDLTGITMPITKCNYLVRDVGKLADIVREAFAIARSGRPGPVLIDILKNVTSETAEYEPLPVEEHSANGRLANLMERSSNNFSAPEPDERDIDILVDMIKAAEKPLIICGGGVVRGRAKAEMDEFIRRVNAPTAITMMGAGGIEGRNPLATGMIGMHGSQASNRACASCDLLIAFGCRFSDRVALNPKSFAKQAKVVQIDIDRAEINKNVKTDHHIVGDCKRVLAILNQKLPEMQHTEWVEHIMQFPRETVYEESGASLTPKQVLATIAKMLPQNTIVATDVGQHQMWAIQHFHFDYPGQLLTSGGFGTMGFGLGAAIGAAKGTGRKTVLFTGDGSFGMNLNELATAVSFNVPVIIVLLNNGVLGMVRQWQSIFYQKHYSNTTLGRKTNFKKLAEAFGADGYECNTMEEFEKAFSEAFAKGGPAVIDCHIDMDEMVLPMTPPGGTVDQMIVKKKDIGI